MIYFIRHATTQANLSGSMVNGYDNADVVSCDSVKWRHVVGAHIPASAERKIISSPAKRCVQTASMLYNRLPDSILGDLCEYDCKALGNLKFWEITESQFNDKVKLTSSEMAEKSKRILELCGGEDCIVFTHGMVIRYMWHYINGNPDISAYDVINSNGFRFSNLDLLVVDPVTHKCDVYRFGEPVNHK